MELQPPNKIRRISLIGKTYIYSYPNPTERSNEITLSATSTKTSGTLQLPISVEAATTLTLSHEGSADPPVIKRRTPLPTSPVRKAKDPGKVNQMDTTDHNLTDKLLEPPPAKDKDSSETSKANVIIISDTEDNDSLFGSPSPSPMPGNEKIQGETQDHVDDSSTNKPEAVMISDDDDDGNSLFGDPSSSDEDVITTLSKQEESLTGTETPDAMSCMLMPHQRIGLQWLLNHEHGQDKGGVLADDMGLGKTIQALALIFANPPTNPTRKTTLIVAPLALLQQWPREIDEKTRPGHKLRVHIYHGNGRQISARQLLSYDVVLTNYDSLTAEFKLAENKKTGMVLLDPDVRFHRVILDEAHNIKNRKTFAARGAFRLQADYRLAMTGTPLMNKSEELYSVMRFLDIPLYSEWEYFNRHIGRPLNNASFSNRTLSRIAMRRINDLKTRTMLVRKKTDLLDGGPIISLPGRTDVIEHCTFDNDELVFYLALEDEVKKEMRKFINASRGDKNFTNLLVDLLRLRQACCHPNLLASDKKQTDDEQPDYLEDLDPETLAAIKNSQGAESVDNSAQSSIDFSSMTGKEIQAMLTKPEPEPEPRKSKKKTRTKAQRMEYYRQLDEDYQPSAKIRKTLQILASIQEKNPQDKVIVFSFFTSFLDILAIGIRRAGFQFKRYDGTLNAAEKDVVIRDFTSPDSSTKILLTSLKSVGRVSLQLTPLGND